MPSNSSAASASLKPIFAADAGANGGEPEKRTALTAPLPFGLPARIVGRRRPMARRRDDGVCEFGGRANSARDHDVCAVGVRERSRSPTISTASQRAAADDGGARRSPRSDR